MRRPLLEGALAQARPQAEAKGLTLAAEPCGGLSARFDRKWTAEALFNVVDNAVKYTPAGGRVTLSAVPLGQFCRVDVSDTGIGIPEEEQGRNLRPLLPGRRCAGGGGGGHRSLPGPGDPAGGRGAMSRWPPARAREPPFPSTCPGNRAFFPNCKI